MFRKLAFLAIVVVSTAACDGAGDPLDGTAVADGGGSPSSDAGSLDGGGEVEAETPGGLLLESAVRRPRSLETIEDGDALFIAYGETTGEPMQWSSWSMRFTDAAGFTEPTPTFASSEQALRGTRYTRGGDGAIYGSIGASDRRAVGWAPAESADWRSDALTGGGGQPPLLSPIPGGARVAWATQTEGEGSWRLLVGDVTQDGPDDERIVAEGQLDGGAVAHAAALATRDGQTAIFASIGDQWRMYWQAQGPAWVMEALPWTDTLHVRAWFTDDGNLHYLRIGSTGLRVGDYAPGRGWSTEQTLGETLPAPVMHVVGDAAAVAWRVDTDVFVAHFHPTRGWTGPEVVGGAPGGAVEVKVRDQSVGVVWLSQSEDGAVRPRYRVFTPGTGWKPAQTVTIPGSEGAEFPYLAFVPGTDEPLIFWTLFSNPAFAIWWARPEAP